MAKAPAEERFRVTCNNVSVADLGTLMAMLTKIGINDVNFDLVTNVAAFKQRTNHEVKGADFLKGWIDDHPTFRAKEAVVHFDLHGRTAGAAYSALRDLVAEGVLKKLGEGNYTRKDVKHLAAPKKAAKPAPKHGDSTKRYDVPNSDLILQIARANGGQFTSAAIKKLFRQRRRNADSVSNAIHTLLTRGQIERVSDGEYKMIRRPLNGPAPVEAEVSNG